jgi:hypothetical protein
MSQYQGIILDLPELLGQWRRFAISEPHELPSTRRRINTYDDNLTGMDQVVTRVTHHCQVVVVIGTPRIAPWNDVVKVQGRRPIKPTDLAPVF